MWPTFLTLWRVRSGKSVQKGKPRRHPAGCRPRLEVLEDRTAPAALGYSTYLGSAVEGVAVQPGDTTGAVYVASGTSVLKLNNGGTGLVYNTVVDQTPASSGGSLYALAVDAAGDAYVIGRGSVSTTPNAIASSGNMFVAELNPAGNLVYATYLPGAAAYISTLGYAAGIAVDGSGNIFVTGAAQAGLPVTAGAYQTAFGGGLPNAFFAKINPTLSGSASLVYATYLGGSSSNNNGDAGTGIALDASGNAYVTGYTHSSNFPTTSGAFQTSFVGAEDVFVAKFNPSLSGAPSLVYSTLLGGSGTGTSIYNSTANSGYVPDNNSINSGGQIDGGIAVDSSGNAYVTAATTSLSFPTTPGAFQTQSNLNQTSGTIGSKAPSDAFVTKLNATGTALVYSTYLGGGANTNSGGAGIALDANGDAYVTGWTNSTVFPTMNPIQASNAGASDAFVTVLNSSGGGLLFSSYLGGSIGDGPGGPWDWGYGIATDSTGNAYVGGKTISSNFPTTPGAYQTTLGQGFLAKINVAASSPSFAVAGFPSPTTAGVSHTFTVTALNADGTVNTGYTGTVHFTSSDPQAVLPADYTFTAADQGTHTFTATLKTAGGQVLAAADAGTYGVVGSESGIAVQPAAAAKFVLSAPASATVGVAFSVTLTVEDAYGNVVPNYTGTVHFSSSDNTATLPANYTFTAADAGVHTWSGVILRKKGNKTLTVTDTLNSSLTATDFISVS
jgi:hypothetical protein